MQSDMTTPGRAGAPMLQRDLTEVLIDVLGELRGLRSAVERLAAEVQNISALRSRLS